MSTYSVLTIASSRLTPSSSRTNLRTAALNKQQSSQTLSRLAGLRDRYFYMQKYRWIMISRPLWTELFEIC